MDNHEIGGFSPAVCERLDYYVYLLRDPATGEVFYVGKGYNNRMFAHASAAIESAVESDKLDRIRAIMDAGRRVHYEVLRHGLAEKEAYEVEAAIIDFIGRDNLSNEVFGHHSWDRGRMSAEDIVALYEAQPLAVDEHHLPAVMININRLFHRGMEKSALYEATRASWKIGRRREQVRRVFSVAHGLVRAVYVPHEWYEVERGSGRWAFHGDTAADCSGYVGKSVGHLTRTGAQNPIKYLRSEQGIVVAEHSEETDNC